MNVGKSVKKSIDEWQQGDAESAMLHACNAVDGTAKKIYGTLGSRARFTRLLRENYDVLGPMGAPGIDLAQTRFPVSVLRPSADFGGADLADVIYGIHRCTHGHGAELPDGFALLPDAAGPARVTRMTITDGTLQLSDRIIFALLGVAVLSPANVDQRTADGYFLTFGNFAKLVINEWWGRVADFAAIAAQDPVPRVKLDFGEWERRRGDATRT
jgi:hypothetical protein